MKILEATPAILPQHLFAQCIMNISIIWIGFPVSTVIINMAARDPMNEEASTEGKMTKRGGKKENGGVVKS